MILRESSKALKYYRKFDLLQTSKLNWQDKRKKEINPVGLQQNICKDYLSSLIYFF